MARYEKSAYEGANLPRPNVWTKPPEPTRAKKHPKYVHGRIGMAMLLHKIDYVEIRWYDYGWHEFIRLKHPSLVARSVCGNYYHLRAGRAGTCELPAPDAVLCGMCHGTGRIWSRGKIPTVTKRQAKDRLGCVVQGD